MFGCILDVHDTFLLHDEAGQTFGSLHGDPADRTFGKALGRLQAESFAVVFQQVDGADIGAHPLCHQVDDVVKSLMEIVGVEDQGAYVLKSPEPQGFRFFFAHVHTSASHSADKYSTAEGKLKYPS